MLQFKSIVLMIIGVAVIFSGCAGNQETKTVDETKQTPATETPASQTPVTQAPIYQVQVTEAKSLQDCIVAYGSKQSCFFINLEFKNNDNQIYDFNIVKDAISTGDGKTLDRYEGEAGLSNLCVRQPGLQFKVNANANQNVGMCYPSVNKNVNPVLNLEVLINGERKEYKFDLSK